MWEKIRQKYYDMTLVNKVMLVFSIFLIIFCAASQIVLQLCLAIYDEKLYEKSLQELDYFIQEVNRSIEEVESLSGEIAMDDGIQEQLTELADMPDTDAAWSLGLLNLREMIASKTNTNLNIRSVAYYDGKAADIVMGVKVTDFPDTVKEELAAPLLAARGGCVMQDPQEDWPYFLVGRNILEKENMRLNYLGTLILNYDMEGLLRRKVSRLEAEHASLYVYNDSFVIYQDEETEGLSLPEFQEGKGYEIVKTGRQKYFMCYMYSRTTGWMYTNVFPYTEIYGQTWHIRIMLMAAILLLAVVFAVAMKGLLGTITKPLNELICSMKIVEGGDFVGARKCLTLERRNDETGQLQKEFDTMLERINELIEENYEKQLLLKDTSYKMLRAQINPHFIYNTLNTINWMVQWKKNDEVSRLIVEFGRILRSAFEGNPFATVGEETALVEGYMAIQAYRYRSRADFVVEKSGDLQKYQTPRMILQPLVENAICYGIEDSLEKCTVRVVVRETADSILYEVSDTGPGMDEETLRAVRDGTVQPKGNGIGLANIRERLRLMFDDSEFVIDSVLGEGTNVHIRIPKREVVQGVQTSKRG